MAKSCNQKILSPGHVADLYLEHLKGIAKEYGSQE